MTREVATTTGPESPLMEFLARGQRAQAAVDDALAAQVAQQKAKRSSAGNNLVNRQLRAFRTLVTGGALREEKPRKGPRVVVIVCSRCPQRFHRAARCGRAATVTARIWAVQHVHSVHPVTYAAHCGLLVLRETPR